MKINIEPISLHHPKYCPLKGVDKVRKFIRIIQNYQFFGSGSGSGFRGPPDPDPGA